MGSRRPLPLPPYPGIIPYRVDSPEDEDAEPDENSPRLLGIENRPVSSFGLPAQRGVTEAREKFYQNWQKQQDRKVWVPSDGKYKKTTNLKSDEDKNDLNAKLSLEKGGTRWPSGCEFLSSTWAFSLSLHSLWSLPISVLQHGGVAYLLMYAVTLAMLGAPLLLLEMSLGQYSGLAPGQLFTHLCPLLGGLGLAVCIQAVVRVMLDMAVVMWAGQALWQLFSQQDIRDGFFYRDVLGKEDASLDHLGELGGQLSLVLAVGCVTIFILMAAGTRSIGKICLVAVPACFLLLIILAVRACLATGGPHGVAILLATDWSVLTQPAVWLEVTGQVIFSLQLGLGTVSAYSSYNSFYHNILTDCVIIITSHLVWVILVVLLTFSLLGVAHHTQTINLTNLASDPALVSITGHGVWLAAITLIETSLATISFGWLWAGLFFILILLVSITSVFGYLEVITSSLISYRPAILPLKPTLTFCIICLIFLLDLVLATQGGIHVYHLLLVYISKWPIILFSLITVLATVFCHGISYLMENLSNMRKLSLPHWLSSHLSVIFFSILPTFLMAALVQVLQVLSTNHLEEPLSTFGLLLPQWGVPMGWSLAFLPLSPLIFWAEVHFLWGNRGVPRLVNLRQSLQPTERWWRHEKSSLTEQGRGPED